MSTSTTSPITVCFHGVRGSIPSPGIETARYGGNTSCVELRCGEDLLILDAGSGMRSLGHDLLNRAGLQSINANLIISHTHWDHIQGLPFFVPGYSSRNRIRIFAAPGYGSRVQQALANQMGSLNFPVPLEMMRGLGAVEELEAALTHLGPFTIRATELNHPGGCAGFRIETAGIAVGYLPDHEPYQLEEQNGRGIKQDQKLIEFVRDLDLLILDTQYTAQEYGQRFGWGHGALPSSVRVAIAGGVRRLLLFHHDPGHDDRKIDQMVESARQLATGSTLMIDAATERATLQLAPSIGAMIISSTPYPSLQKKIAV